MAKKYHSEVKVAASPKKTGHKLDRISVGFAKNGGHTVEHHYSGGDGMSYRPSDTYAFGTSKEALDHLSKHMSGPNESSPGGKADDDDKKQKSE